MDIASGIEEFDQALRAAGVPIDGVSGSGAGARIDFAPAATKEQRDAAAAILAVFDWQPKRRKTSPELLLEIAALPADLHQILIDMILAEWLARNPEAAKFAGITTTTKEP